MISRINKGYLAAVAIFAVGYYVGRNYDVSLPVVKKAGN